MRAVLIVLLAAPARLQSPQELGMQAAPKSAIDIKYECELLELNETQCTELEVEFSELEVEAMKSLVTDETKTWSSAQEELFEAVRTDDPAAIRAALQAGADVNGHGPATQTPLLHAVSLGRAAAMRELLERGADTAIGDSRG